MYDGSSAGSATTRSTSITGLAGSPTTEVEPTWWISSTRSPSAARTTPATRSKSAGQRSSYSTTRIWYGRSTWPGTHGSAPGGSSWKRVISVVRGHAATLARATLADLERLGGAVGGDHPDPRVVQEPSLEPGAVDGPDQQRDSDLLGPARQAEDRQGVVSRDGVGVRVGEAAVREHLTPEPAYGLGPRQAPDAGADAHPDQDARAPLHRPRAHRPGGAAPARWSSRSVPRAGRR